MINLFFYGRASGVFILVVLRKAFPPLSLKTHTLSFHIFSLKVLKVSGFVPKSPVLLERNEMF